MASREGRGQFLRESRLRGSGWGQVGAGELRGSVASVPRYLTTGKLVALARAPPALLEPPIHSPTQGTYLLCGGTRHAVLSKKAQVCPWRSSFSRRGNRQPGKTVSDSDKRRRDRWDYGGECGRRGVWIGWSREACGWRRCSSGEPVTQPRW